MGAPTHDARESNSCLTTSPIHCIVFAGAGSLLSFGAGWNAWSLLRGIGQHFVDGPCLLIRLATMIRRALILLISSIYYLLASIMLAAVLAIRRQRKSTVASAGY